MEICEIERLKNVEHLSHLGYNLDCYHYSINFYCTLSATAYISREIVQIPIFCCAFFELYLGSVLTSSPIRRGSVPYRVRFLHTIQRLI